MPAGFKNFTDNPEHRRKAQRVFVDRATNDVILRLHETDIVRVKPNGDVILSTGGWATHKTINGMNDAMELFDMWVEAADGNPPRGNWRVYDIDGTHIPYINNRVDYTVTIKAKGADAANRCMWLAGAFNVPYTPTPSPAAARIVSGPPRPALQAPSPPAAPPPPAVPAPTAAASPRGPLPAAAGPRSAVAAPAAATVPRPLAPPPRQQGAGSWANVAATGLHPPSRPAPGQHQGRTNGPGAASTSQSINPGGTSVVATSPGNNSLRALEVARQKLAGKPVEEQLAEHMNQLGIDEAELDDDQHMCVVCFEALRTIVLVPCGHMALCKDCCEAIIVKQGKECPLCCQPVEYHVEVDG